MNRCDRGGAFFDLFLRMVLDLHSQMRQHLDGTYGQTQGVHRKCLSHMNLSISYIGTKVSQPTYESYVSHFWLYILQVLSLLGAVLFHICHHSGGLPCVI